MMTRTEIESMYERFDDALRRSPRDFTDDAEGVRRALEWVLMLCDDGTLLDYLPDEDVPEEAT